MDSSDPVSERVRELTGGRELTQREWMSLLGKGVIAVQEAFERDGSADRPLTWSEIARAHDGRAAPARALPAGSGSGSDSGGLDSRNGPDAAKCREEAAKLSS